MKRILLRLKDRAYSIYIKNGAIKDSGQLIRSLNIGDTAIIITNQSLKNIFGLRVKKSLLKAGIKSDFIIVPGSEKAKSAGSVFTILNKIAHKEERRRIFLVSLGGGVITDLTGFAASIYKRGIPYVQIPTTLLAQVDAGIGGKTAIDLKSGKNLCGSFYHPAIVISDTSALASLPAKEIRAGLSEVLKYALIMDKRFFAFLERTGEKLLSSSSGIMEEIVARCSRFKAGIVEDDERETKGVRTILNFGHTIGHGIEKAGDFTRYGHGEAVALGMIAESYISARLNILPFPEYERIRAFILSLKLAGRLKNAPASRIMKAILLDKKFKGKTNRFALIRAIGTPEIRENVPPGLIKEALGIL